jgi:hypothetical protein
MRLRSKPTLAAKAWGLCIISRDNCISGFQLPPTMSNKVRVQHNGDLQFHAQLTSYVRLILHSVSPLRFMVLYTSVLLPHHVDDDSVQCRIKTSFSIDLLAFSKRSAVPFPISTRDEDTSNKPVSIHLLCYLSYSTSPVIRQTFPAIFGRALLSVCA